MFIIYRSQDLPPNDGKMMFRVFVFFLLVDEECLGLISAEADDAKENACLCACVLSPAFSLILFCLCCSLSWSSVSHGQDVCRVPFEKDNERIRYAVGL